MTIERVTIEGAVMRVSVAGVDVSSAQFNNLIFDGNQPPLRLWMSGWVGVPVLANGSGSTLVTTQGPSLSVAGGVSPIFFTCVRQPIQSGVVNPGAVGNNNSPSFRTQNNYGCGGTITDVGGGVSNFYGMNFNRENPAGTAFGNDGIVNYSIMRNVQ